MNAAHVIWDCSERPEITFAPNEQLVFRCTHCGDRFVLGLPVSVTMASIVGKQYVKEHARCKRRPEKP